MATSGVYPSVTGFQSINIIDLAFIRAGISEQKTEAEHTYVALQELRLLLIELVNRGVNQFMITQETQSLVIGDESFTAPSGTIDILKAVYRQNGQDIEVGQISRDDYLTINQKDSQGTPLNYFVDKTSLPPTIYLWPVPNVSGLSLVYYRLKLMQDFTKLTETADTTVLFIDVLVWGLAKRLSWIYKPERFDVIANLYQEAYEFAYHRDGDNANLILMPRLGRSYNVGGN